MRFRFLLRGGWLAAGLGLLPAGTAWAQLLPDSARLVLKAELVPLLKHSYAVQVEYRLARLLSLTLTPQVVAGTVPSSVSTTANAAGDQVRGYGCSLGPRLYLPGTSNQGVQLDGLYVSVQAAYQHLRLHYRQAAWGEDLAPDGLRYYVFRDRDFLETIARYGGVATLGYQTEVFHPRLRLDMSASLNRFSSHFSASGNTRYNSSPGDYANPDNYLSLDLSLGFSLK